jgi:hypothetical protein
MCTPVVTPVAALNPDAGFHAVPSDAREVEAAVRAGDASLRRFPYFEWRYGERARRFGHSDSAWLVTLAGLPPPLVERQVRWLGVLLSSRGMPQLLLERHLQTLHAELVAAVPERRADYDTLVQVAGVLRDDRLRHVDGERFATLAALFDDAVGSEWAERRAGIGELLVAAVADERSGVEHAVSSLTEWLTDPERFSPAWIEAVRRTIAAARRGLIDETT